MIEDIKTKMQTQGNGFCAVIDGVLNPMTFSVTKNRAAQGALMLLKRALVLTTCTDEDCECMVEVLAREFPTAKIVRVNLTVAP